MFDIKQALSNRVKSLGESATLKMARMATELKNKGVDVVDMSLGEPDFNTPDVIKNAAKLAIDQNWTRYSPVPGYLDLRQAICDKFKRDQKVEFTPDQIVVSTGAKQSIANVLLALLNPGDEVLVPGPFWVSYRDMIEFMGGRTVEVPTTIESNFKLNIDQLMQLKGNYKAFLFSNPCNPSGNLLTQKDLDQLLPFFLKHKDMVIISDEIYEYIFFDEKAGSMTAYPELRDRVVIVNGVSKGQCMTGWRLGYMAGPKEIAAACSKIQGQFTSGTSSITQRAAITAMKMEVSEFESMRLAFKKRAGLIFEELKQIAHLKTNKPEGAFYIFPDISNFLGKHYEGKKIKDTTEFCLYMLESHHLAMTPGDAFGAPNSIRLSFATSEDKIREACRRLKRGLEQLK
jgi:aspartate aminotransferase